MVVARAGTTNTVGLSMLITQTARITKNSALPVCANGPFRGRQSLRSLRSAFFSVPTVIASTIAVSSITRYTGNMGPDKCGAEVGLLARCQRPANHDGEHSGPIFVPQWITYLGEGDEIPRSQYQSCGVEQR